MYTRLKIITIFTCLLLVNSIPAAQAEGETAKKNADSEIIHYDGNTLFQSLKRPKPLEISLKFDVDLFLENRNNGEYQKGQIEYETLEGEMMAYDIKVRTRGKFRRRVCDFPPIKLKFPKKVLLAQGYAEFNTLKLVTHCLDGKEESYDNVYREYLAYKMYNELTEKSFQVQLVKITYHDVSGKHGKKKRFGFIIENTDEMASRLNGSICDCLNVDPETVVAKDENLMALYQYMIGNADWSTKLNRNLKLVNTANQEIIPVPYDFDFAGFVDAAYAIPSVDYGLKSIKDRIFLGYKADRHIQNQNLFLFKQKKATFLKMIDRGKIADETRQELLNYINAFFENIRELSLL